jgi:hypothetical protein
MEILRPLLCVNRGELRPRSGLRFAIGVREGPEVATANGFVFFRVGGGRRGSTFEKAGCY